MINQFEHWGVPITLEGFDGDHISETIRRTGDFFEPEFLRTVWDYVVTMERDRRSSVVVDVGAYIGNHTVLFGTFLPVQQVIAVEPNPKAFEVLQRNIAANNLGNMVVPYQCALGSAPGEAGIELGKESNLGHTRITEGNDVEVRTLDDIVPEDKRVSVIKIDVEGAELDVLKGASRLLAEQSPAVFVEVLGQKAHVEVNELLRSHGYSLRDYQSLPFNPMFGYFKEGYRDWMGDITLREIRRLFLLDIRPEKSKERLRALAEELKNGHGNPGVILTATTTIGAPSPSRRLTFPTRKRK